MLALFIPSAVKPLRGEKLANLRKNLAAGLGLFLVEAVPMAGLVERWHQFQAQAVAMAGPG